MAGTCADVSGAGVSGGAGGEQPVAAEDADAEVTLWRRCQEAGVAYVAPGEGKYRAELKATSGYVRSKARDQRRQALRQAIRRARTSGPMVSSSVDKHGHRGVHSWTLACNGPWTACNGSVVAPLSMGRG